MKTLIPVLTLVLTALIATAADKPRRVDPLTSHPVRSYNGKSVDFTKAIASVRELLQLRAAPSSDPLVIAENRKRMQAVERDLRPWLPMLVDGHIMESKAGLVIVRDNKTRQPVAITNAPAKSDGSYVALAFPVGRVRYGGASLPLFDYGQPVTP